MKIKTIKKIETIEDFRENLLKIFFSNQEKREIYLKPTLMSDCYKEMKGRPFYYSVDNINSFTQFLDMLCMGVIKIQDKKFQTKNSFGKREKEEILNFDITEDDNEFMYEFEHTYWIYIGIERSLFILQTICSSDFIERK